MHGVAKVSGSLEVGMHSAELINFQRWVLKLKAIILEEIQYKLGTPWQLGIFHLSKGALNLSIEVSKYAPAPLVVS